MRVGEGYDVHRLEVGRRLVLAGVEIDSDRGAVGHSDGDAATHALCDALLGAVAAGDIGTHFPPSDERWRDADSMLFLREVVGLLAERGAHVVHVDLTIVLERPRLAPYRDAMRNRLAEALGCTTDRVSVKAKTAEGLGAVGSGEAVESRAVATVRVDP